MGLTHFMQLKDFVSNDNMKTPNPFPSSFIWNTDLGLSFSVPVTSMEVIQKKAVDNICNAVYNAHTGPLFKQLNVQKLADIYNAQI